MNDLESHIEGVGYEKNKQYKRMNKIVNILDDYEKEY